MKAFKLARACAIFILITSTPSLEGANILFFMGLGTYSHRLLVWPLVERLVDSGHNVTFYQPIKSNLHHPEVTEYFPGSLATLLKRIELKLGINDLLHLRLAEGRSGIMKALTFDMPSLGIQFCEALMSVPETQHFLETSFDLVIIDTLSNECGYGIAHKVGARTIALATSSLFLFHHDVFGFPLENYWIPDFYYSSGAFPLGFLERVATTLLELYIKYEREVNYLPQLDEILRMKLNMPGMPSFRELEKETALILVNTHFTEEYARSLPPMVVSVGGIHCPDQDFRPKPLPKDMGKFVQESGDDGFIYVSFGSAVQISAAPEYFRNIFFTAFRNSKTRFIWKWEGPRPKEIPNNVFTANWIPQLDILARKPKAFIMHGGLLGIQEALTFEIPIIVMPIFAEQDYNAFRIEHTGRGIRLDTATLTAQGLTAAITEILANQTYKENAVKISKLFKDRPMKPADEALWWVEYVLRNNDTSTLKPLAMEQYWIQRHLLDVWGFLTATALALIILSVFVLKILYTFLASFFCKVIHCRPSEKLKRS